MMNRMIVSAVAWALLVCSGCESCSVRPQSGHGAEWSEANDCLFAPYWGAYHVSSHLDQVFNARLVRHLRGNVLMACLIIPSFQAESCVGIVEESGITKIMLVSASECLSDAVQAKPPRDQVVKVTTSSFGVAQDLVSDLRCLFERSVYSAVNYPIPHSTDGTVVEVYVHNEIWAARVAECRSGGGPRTSAFLDVVEKMVDLAAAPEAERKDKTDVLRRAIVRAKREWCQ